MLFEDSEDLAKPRIKRILFFKPHDNQVRILQEIERILQDAEQYNCMSEFQKLQTAKCIRKLGFFPAEFRRSLWILSSGAEQARKANPEYYCIKTNRFSMNDSFDVHRNQITARPLLESYKKMPDPYSEQIQLDLMRTFTDDEEFMN